MKEESYRIHSPVSFEHQNKMSIQRIGRQRESQRNERTLHMYQVCDWFPRGQLWSRGWSRRRRRRDWAASRLRRGRTSWRRGACGTYQCLWLALPSDHSDRFFYSTSAPTILLMSFSQSDNAGNLWTLTYDQNSICIYFHQLSKALFV